MNSSKTFIFFIITSVACVAVRYMQLVSAIDFETGFYYNHAGFLGGLLYIIFAAGFVGIVAFSFIDKRKKHQFFVKKMSLIDETETVIISFMFILMGVVLIFGFVSIFGGRPAAIEVINGLIGITGFLAVGLLLYIRKRITALSGYLLLLPCIYYTVRAISVFMEHLVITRMSEYLIILLSDILLVFFFLGLGRIFSRNEGRFTRVRTAVCGFSAAALIFSETIAKIIYWLTSSGAMRDYLSADGTKFIMPDMQTSAEGIIVITLLIIMLKTPYKKSDGNNAA